VSKPHSLTTASETGWHKHTGRKCPVEPDAVVRPWFGFGRARYTYEARLLNWKGFCDLTRIRGYRLEGGE
jgi:hypothetical protein